MKLVKKDVEHDVLNKRKIRELIDSEMGKGFSNNVNLDGYVFKKNGSFVVFQLKNMDGVKVCHVKYIFFESERDLVTILANCCNFWMGNRVQFIFYREKVKAKGCKSALDWLANLNFRKEMSDNYEWKWNFECPVCKTGMKVPCKCSVYSMFK